MTMNNKMSNWLWGVQRVRTKGAKNAGRYYDPRSGQWVICKYDWSKPFEWVSKAVPISKGGGVFKYITHN